MTTEAITTNCQAQALSGLRLTFTGRYNSAWPEAAPSALAGSADLTMKRSDDGSASAAELRAFIDSMPALAWSCRPDGSAEFINQRFHEYSGLSTDWIYEGWKSTLHPDDMEVFEAWWLGLQKSPKLGQAEVRFRRADGVYRWFQIAAAPVHDEHGNPIRWYGINTDIDDRKRAEQYLRQTEGELRTIIDAIRQAVVVLAPDGRTLYANRAALEITGLTIGEVSDNSFLTRAFHPEDVDRIREQRQQRLLRGVPFELEMRVLFKSGEYRWFLNQYNPLKDEQGGIIRWYVTGTDIDDQKRMEERPATKISFCERKSIGPRCLKRSSVPASRCDRC
jgi:PAS domain S-box-containing protein